MKKLIAVSLSLSAFFFIACNNEKKAEAPVTEPVVTVAPANDSVRIILPDTSPVRSKPGFLKNKKLNLRMSKDSMMKLKRAEQQ